MKSFIAVICLGAVMCAHAGVIAPAVAPLAYSAIAPAAVSNQYHAQDELGQYSYGYAGGPSSKQESRTADGITRGGYSYLDANGLVQSVNYVSDPVNGFRVAATNLPVGPAPVAPALPLAAAPIAPYAAAPLAAAPLPYAGPLAAAPLPSFAAYSAGVVHAGPLPLPPADTPEVNAAKAAHFAAHAEAKLRG